MLSGAKANVCNVASRTIVPVTHSGDHVYLVSGVYVCYFFVCCSRLMFLHSEKKGRKEAFFGCCCCCWCDLFIVRYVLLQTISFCLFGLRLPFFLFFVLSFWREYAFFVLFAQFVRICRIDCTARVFLLFKWQLTTPAQQ